MKIALVCCPPWSCHCPPLPLATLQAQLKIHGHEVIPVDFHAQFNYSHKNMNRLLKILAYLYFQNAPKIFYPLFAAPNRYYKDFIGKISAENPDVVCFSTYKYNMPVSIYTASKLKKANQKIKIYFGGPGCINSALRDFALKSGCIDKIISSNAEYMMQELLEILGNKTRIADINEEPLPDFSGFQLERYDSRFLPYSTTRGCFKRCSFCFDIVFWKRYRQKSAAKIYEDLKKLKELHGINAFFFADSVMLGTKGNIEEFCDLAIKNGLKIRWSGQIRAQNLDKVLLKKMRDAGCAGISIGIESGSQRILNLMNKDSNIMDVEAVVKDASEAGIRVTGLFIVGYPTETWKDYFKTIKFVISNKRHLYKVYPHMLSILEGTKLHNTADALNIKRKGSFLWHSKGNNFLIRLLRFTILSCLAKLLVNKRPAMAKT